MKTWHSRLEATAPRASILIRGVVELVFASKGIQKILYAVARGAGLCAKIGIRAPEVMEPVVGVVKVVCGSLLLVGLATRLAALPLVVNVLVAMASIKVPILHGHGYWIFAHTFAPKSGFGAFLHESRTDLTMLWGGSFLVLLGSADGSLDARLGKPPSTQRSQGVS